MPLSTLMLIILFGLTALNWTIHWYTQVVTYRLFPNIANSMTGPDFVRYHGAYQMQLVWAIYLPWSLLVLLSIAALALAPPGAAPWLWILFGLNSAIGILSFALAVPVHRRIDQEARLDPTDAKGLMRANTARLMTASVSLILCFAITLATLSNPG
jgi:hypothetical protein